MAKRRQCSKKQNILLAVILLFLFSFIVTGLYCPLSVSHVTVQSEKIDAPVRIALVSDLHSCRYGKRQEKLLRAIQNENPDLVCLVGDIFDDDLSYDNAEIFLRKISARYPCYYVTGNHEYWDGEEAFRKKMALLEECGIHRLSNESTELLMNGQKLVLSGVNDPYFMFDREEKKRDRETSRAKEKAYLEEVLQPLQHDAEEDTFRLLLSHRPEYFSLYEDYGFDLTLSGHAHGGQWALPYLLPNGLFAPNQGLFPKYTNGTYTLGASVLVVSRGLSRENNLVPRFFNRPEVVIIDLSSAEVPAD